MVFFFSSVSFISSLPHPFSIGLLKLRDGSRAMTISLKNLKSNGYISRPVGVTKSKKIIRFTNYFLYSIPIPSPLTSPTNSSEGMLGLEMLDVSSPTWYLFGNLMTDPQPLFLGKVCSFFRYCVVIWIDFSTSVSFTSLTSDTIRLICLLKMSVYVSFIFNPPYLSL